MKKMRFLMIAMMAMAASFTACDDDDNNPDNGNTKVYDFTGILNDYVDKTIIPTYSAMYNSSEDLLTKAKAFENKKNQINLQAVADAWKATRAPWEKSESFLFGPAGDQNLDPLLDSWPVDEKQLTNVINNKAQVIDADYVANGLGYTTRGFHTVEYLIFREGKVRKYDDVKEREIAYLVASAEVLRNDCLKLWASWEGGTGKEALLKELEIEIGTPHGTEYKNAGKAGSRYLTKTHAIDEMVQGIVSIADELGKTKMGTPHGGKGKIDPSEAESRFSHNSLTDFKNNLLSIENSYMGGFDVDKRGIGLTAFVKSKDEALDTEAKAKIKAAIDAIDACPEAFVENLKTTEVETAMTKIAELEEFFAKKIKALLDL